MKIKEALDYNAETGVITWKVGRFTHVLGKEAGYIDQHGYRCIQFDGLMYKAHIIGWLLHYGEYPKQSIDHINRIKSDNRIINLRLATRQQNNANTDKKIRGVYKHYNKWKAQLKQGGYLGLFNTKEEAYEAVKKAHKEVYGEFSPCE